LPDNHPKNHGYYRQCTHSYQSSFSGKKAVWEQKGLFLYFLPGYSPELNLIEILWRFIKYWWLPFSAYLNFRRLVEAVEDILIKVGANIKSLFSKLL